LVFDLSIAHDRFGSSSHVQQNGHLTHPQDLDGQMRVAAQRKFNAYGRQYADNQNISFLPAIMSTSTSMHGEFLRLLFLQAHRETEAHCSWNVIATLPIGLVPFQARCILPVAEEQSRTRCHQSGGIEDQPQCRGLWHSGSPSARSFSRSPWAGSLIVCSYGQCARRRHARLALVEAEGPGLGIPLNGTNGRCPDFHLHK
jgi:hypothetical protein